MERLTGFALGAIAGAVVTTMGLIDFSNGGPDWTGGGNESTSLVIVIGVVVGALFGGTLLWKSPLAIVGLIVGLIAGMWLRDNIGMGDVQPPWVFLLLFGLPAIGLAAGMLIHRKA